MASEHGGRLRSAAALWNIPLERWLDLSTGINPQGFIPGEIPLSAWLQLPQDDDELGQRAARYYGVEPDCLLPTGGSQAAIQALPGLRAHCRVGMIPPLYYEHPRAWSRAGHQVVLLEPTDLEKAAQELDVLVICNPNNPTGSRLTAATLDSLLEKLAARHGWLIVDEAFADVDVDRSWSVATRAGKPGLIVLRSLGKFFGLAGARVGFVLAWNNMISTLADRLGPWCISGPSRFVAGQALADTAWQQQARLDLEAKSKRLHELLTGSGLPPAGGTAFFQWVCTEQATRIHELLAESAILTRLFSEPPSLRFGLPADEDDWQRLQEGLRLVSNPDTFKNLFLK